jgi:hypothetical protein
MEYLVLVVLVAGFALVYFKKESVTEYNLEEDKNRILELEKSLVSKETEAKQQQQNIDIANAKTNAFEQVKTENTTLKEKLSNTEHERNNLKNENIFLKKEEENRNETLRKSVESTNTLQDSLKTEIARVNDERVKDEQIRLEKMKLSWSEHERDIQNHIQLICNNHIIKYVEKENFPHPKHKPDNSIEIMDQLIVFDAKSPGSDDLSNFPKYIKLQTESLEKYAKHDNVKKDLFLVIPSNTLQVINKFTYNIGNYNVYIVSKDALEPIILSLKKIEDYEFADKLSPEERDNVCRIIGKFAHTTKRRIQIDQFFAEEFLDTLNKAGTQLPRDILESVIQFENAEKLNPPMEKRKQQILTIDLKNKSEAIKKEIALRKIPEIQANIEFKEDDDN